MPRGPRWTIGSLATIALASSGCDRCTPEDPSPPPEGYVDRPANTYLEQVEPPPSEAPARLWRSVAKEGWGAEAEPPEKTVRWQVPSCPLRYVLRSRHLYDVAEGREPAGQAIRVEIVANPSEGGVTLQATEVATSLVADGARGTPSQHATIDWALPQVTTDGTSWRELDGPTTLWSAYSTVPALTGFFPDLPRAGQVGARIAWGVDIHQQRTTKEIERRRAEGRPVPSVTPTHRERSLEVTGFIDLDGATALVLEGSWSMMVDIRDRMLMRRAERWRGHFVVVADSGRLLHAALVGRSLQELELDDRERRESRGRGEIELRLVEACDGPTLPPVPTLAAGPL